MTTTRSVAERVHRRAAVAALAAAALTIGVAGCGSSGSNSSSTTTTAGGGVTTTAGPTTTTAATTTTEATSTTGPLVGTWTADSQSILGATMASAGGPHATCTGPVNLEFKADGTFTDSATATCTFSGVSATAVVDSSGRWAAGPRRIVISAARDRGTITVAGASRPLPGGFAVGAIPYEISGDTLTLTFTVASVGTVTHTYHRA